MRRILLIAGVAAGVLILISAAVVGYAVLNLDSIIAANRERILARASDALGRTVAADDIKATIGWGVAMDVTGVKIADDPAFAAQLPFVSASDAYLKVEFVPLLFKRLKITDLMLKAPQVRIIRNAAGKLNVSTLGRKHHEASATKNPSNQPGGAARSLGANPMESAPPPAIIEIGGNTRLNAISVRTFTIQDGTVTYEDQNAGGPPLTINALNLSVDHFTFSAPFAIKLTLAALGNDKNLDVSGTVGPLASRGVLDFEAVPIDLTVNAGPLIIAQLKSLPSLARSIPQAVLISDTLTFNGTLSGTIQSTSFSANTDLTGNRVAYPPNFDKPSGVPLKVAANGSCNGNEFVVRQARITLANVDANLTNLSVTHGVIRAHVDTNTFDIAPVARLIPSAAKYNPSGNTTIHSEVSLAGGKPALNGTAELSGVSLAPPAPQAPPMSDLNGTIRLAGNTASVEPLTFKLGSGQARLDARASSLQPLTTTYRVSVDKLMLAQLIPNRSSSSDENLVRVAAAGNLSLVDKQISASTNATVASGMLANVAFSNLAADARYTRSQLTLDSLALNAFSGSINTTGVVTVAPLPSFDLRLNGNNVDLHEALLSQHAKAANTIRGLLTGALQILGRGQSFDQIKPTLHGTGRAALSNGKLVGVNVVAEALNKVGDLPGIGALIPASVVNGHPELFRSRDTDIDSASLTFVILAGRIVSNDILVRSPDYDILAHGWFDFDKNLDLVAKILMSRGFSDDMVAAKRNVVYLTNSDGRIEIPLRVSGQLPKPTVAPDVGNLAQRAASHAVENRLGGLLQKKGLGGILGGGGSGGNNGGGSFKNPFKGLFH